LKVESRACADQGYTCSAHAETGHATSHERCSDRKNAKAPHVPVKLTINKFHEDRLSGCCMPAGREMERF